jgi:hypothetical protein
MPTARQGIGWTVPESPTPSVSCCHFPYSILEPQSRNFSSNANLHGIALLRLKGSSSRFPHHHFPSNLSHMTKTFTLAVAAALIVAPLAYTQDKETEEQIREATEAAKKMGVQMPDVKKMMEEDAQEEAKEKDKVQAALNAPGPVAFPDWTPKEKFKNDKCQFSRMKSNINQTITQTVTLIELEEPNQEVTLEATRAPRENITHVTLSAPQPTPAEARKE